MKDIIAPALGVLLVLAIGLGGLALSCHNYRECRADGHGKLYCATAIH